MSTILWL